MSSLYLTEVELSQFRGFDSLRVDLPGEPGILIVHGSNGLGKSSLFDALEWTLTDGIEHFRAAAGHEKVGRYLCRWRPTPGPTSASLRFSDGSTIERRLSSFRATTSSLAGSVGDITAFLRAPSWGQPISSVGRYLLLTHFLGQSTASRLTHKTSGERFDMLKEAAQSAEIEAIGLALHGKGNTHATRAFNRRLAELERGADGLRHLLRQEQDLWMQSQASGALDDVAATEVARRAVDAIRRASLQAVEGQRDLADLLGASGLQASIDAATANIRRRRIDVERSRLLVDEQRGVLMDAAATAAAATEAKGEAARARADVLAAVADASVARERRDVVRVELTSVRRTQLQLTELDQGRARLTQVREEALDAAAALKRAEDTLAEVERRASRLERRNGLSTRLRDELSFIDHDLATRRVEADAMVGWLHAQGLAIDIQTELSHLEVEHPTIELRVAEANADALRAAQVADEQAALLSQLRDTVGTITAAVASIAASLPLDACECPVCATTFANAGILRYRAAAAAERIAPTLARQEEATSKANGERVAASSRLAILGHTLDRIVSVRRRLASARDESDRSYARIGLIERHDAAEVKQALSRSRAVISELEAKRGRRARWAQLLAGGGSTIASSDAEFERSRDSARRVKDAASRRLTALEANHRSLSNELAEREAALLRPEESASRSLSGAIQAASTLLATVQAQYDDARDAAEAQDERVVELQRREASIQALDGQIATRLSNLKWRSNAIASQWSVLGWGDEAPDTSQIEALAQDLVSAQAATDEAADLLRRLRDGREAWERQQSHRAAFERLRAAVDMPPNGERVQLLQTAERELRKTEGLAEATRKVKAIAQAASNDISDEVSNFNSEFIQPLGNLMRRINKAVLCDQRIGIDLFVNGRKIEQSASRMADLPAEIEQIDPMLVHSEGQMAALAVSMLCAASLTYPWSRWRALILDDPLQHNDAIHAAAFADLVANLVCEKGYQVLISTHDLAQAEFLQRKFGARRIPCAQLSLLGRRRDGVEWSFLPATMARSKDERLPNLRA